MQLIIKVLKGAECEVNNLSETTTVYELKQQIESQLRIPIAHQKILCVGRTLVDEKQLGAYKPALRSGCKLTLVVKEPEQLKDVMSKVFKRFYSEQKAERLAKELMADQERRVGELSLDDLERMAGYFLGHGKTVAANSSAATAVTATVSAAATAASTSPAAAANKDEQQVC